MQYDTPTHPDRSLWMTILGVLEILLGLLLGVAAAVSVKIVPGWGFGAGLICMLAALAFAGLGYGSIRGRRWARTLLVLASAGWLASGLYAVLMLAMRGRGSLPSHGWASRIAFPRPSCSSY